MIRVERQSPFSARLEFQPRDEVGREVEALCACEIGRGILDGKGPLVACASAARRPAKQRLPEPRDGIQAFEVDPDGVGLRIRKRGPGLADDEAIGLEERVPKPRRPAGIRRSRFR